MKNSLNWVKCLTFWNKFSFSKKKIAKYSGNQQRWERIKNETIKNICSMAYKCVIKINWWKKTARPGIGYDELKRKKIPV